VNLESYRRLFFVIILGVASVVASPVIGEVIPEEGSERFSEFWILGPNHVAEDYPFNVSIGDVYRVFIGVGNHMSNSEYYMVYVKLFNGTDSLSAINDFQSSSSDPLYEFKFFLDDEKVWEKPLIFGFEDVDFESNVLSVGNIIINDVVFPVHASVLWDSERMGYFFEMFFELWRYDVEHNNFRFDDRLVSLTLNMTGS
jgi:hypothetical protein